MDVGYKRLLELADKCALKTWGEGVVIEYYGDQGAVRRAECTIVQHPEDDVTPLGFSVLLLRQLPNLIEGFNVPMFEAPDEPLDETMFDPQSIEFTVAGLANGLLNGLHKEGGEGDGEVEGFGTKTLSMAELTQLVNEFPQICFTSRPDGFVDWMNKQWYEYTGLPQGVVSPLR